MIDLIERINAPAKMKRPAKVWHNWWRARRPLVTSNGEDLNDGDEVEETTDYPSKEIAIEAAARTLERHPPGIAEYIGAYPAVA